MAADEASRNPGEDWRRLSAWSIPHFVVSRVIKFSQALLYGVPAGFGVSRTDFAELIWLVPLALAIALTTWSVLQYIFTRYRVTGNAVELQSGALFKRRVNLAFERIQNVNIVEPFYFRPIGFANLSIDSAGSANDEVEVAALPLVKAEELRTYISAMRKGSAGTADVAIETLPDGSAVADAGSQNAPGEAFFERSLSDLVIHGLTNNRAFIAVAGIMGVFWQSGVSTQDIVDYFGIDFDLIIAGLSLVRFVILLVLSFILAIGMLALLSVLVSIVSYFGFTMYRSGPRLIVRRGLINKHEIAVRKSRIQSIRLSQDWLDYLFRRRNLYLEQLTHAPQGGQQPQQNKHVIVPSVRHSETREVTDEIWPLESVESIDYTPLHWRWFRKWAVIVTALNVLAFVFVTFVLQVHAGFSIAAVALWPALMVLVYMTWKRGGLAVNGNMIVTRSGTIGINYRLFPIAKLQEVARVQTPFMRRRNVSTLVFMTAASRIRVPYLPGEFAKQVVNLSLYDVEARPQSWM